MNHFVANRLAAVQIIHVTPFSASFVCKALRADAKLKLLTLNLILVNPWEIQT